MSRYHKVVASFENGEGRKEWQQPDYRTHRVSESACRMPLKAVQPRLGKPRCCGSGDQGAGEDGEVEMARLSEACGVFGRKSMGDLGQGP